MDPQAADSLLLTARTSLKTSTNLSGADFAAPSAAKRGGRRHSDFGLGDAAKQIIPTCRGHGSSLDPSVHHRDSSK